VLDFGLLTPYVWAGIILALIFDFFNGVNDSANSIATVVATRALKPVYAVGLAAVMNFGGAFLGTAVAKTIGEGIIDPNVATTTLIIAALAGGGIWTALATKFGVPISVSHSLIGGLIGAALAAVGLLGVQVPQWGKHVQPVLAVLGEGAAFGTVAALLILLLVGGRRPGLAVFAGSTLGSAVWLVLQIALGGLKVQKLLATVLFIVYSPLLGFVMAYGFNVAIIWIARKYPPAKLNPIFRVLQLFSASFYSLGHGTNDAQKTMGVITVLLVVNGAWGSLASIPWEVKVAAAAAISLGTFIGGYRVVRTMGHRLTALQPYQGFAAETSSALGLVFLAHQGVPVSTTHSIAGSIMGVGATQRVTAVSWGLARHIMGAWIITIPASAIVSMITYWVLARIVGA
jgi:inorganic phosphate transporter, PiT family